MTAVFTNTRETVDRTVTKIWNDNNNSSGTRPSSVEIRLADDTGIIDTVLVGYDDSGSVRTGTDIVDENTWTYTWTDLQKYRGEEEIVYTVSETTPVSGNYRVSYSEDTFTVTNMVNGYTIRADSSI